MTKALVVLLVSWMNPDGTTGVLLEEVHGLETCYDRQEMLEEQLRSEEWEGLLTSWDVTCVSENGEDLRISIGPRDE